ncbi:MAG: prepilin-type N-terminal cleavage/methylation domain-containing protein [Armatimonadota bacterium]
MRKLRKGFTLIEVLMVVVLIAILMLIVVLRIRFIGMRARESALRDNLHELRSAVTRFENDVGGNPTELDQLLLVKSDALDELPEEDAAGNKLDAKHYKGPYIVPNNRLPTDPFAEDSQFGYDPNDGYVYSKSDRMSMDGSPYSTW